jgi:4-diphosphocytidyl-2-C-methyl-D-erythritol kinase
LRLLSFAKINLGLRVLGKRTDGFHEIETVFQQISLYDEMEITLGEAGIELWCDSPDCPSDHTNLAYRAAVLLQRTASDGCRIKITKKIPVGAGLGGGSSNGATALLGLNRLWKMNVPVEGLLQRASRLGSDVPFFISGGTMLGRGRGELLTPIHTALSYWGVLVSPPLHISSGWAYQNSNFSLTKSIKKSKLNGFTRNFDNVETWQKELKNDLEPVVFHHYPVCHEIVKKMLDSGAFFSRMSGSGSTVFGLFKTRDAAQRASLNFERLYRVHLFEPVYSKNY